MPEDDGSAGVGHIEAREDGEQRRLPGSRRPLHGEDLARIEMERDVVEGSDRMTVGSREGPADAEAGHGAVHAARAREATTWPSRNVTTRSARRAISVSWVTITTLAAVSR